MGNLLGSLSSLSATNTKSKEALVLAWVSGEKLFYRVLTSPHSQYSMWWPYQSKILVRQREGPSWPSGDSFLVIGSIQKFLNALVKNWKVTDLLDSQLTREVIMLEQNHPVAKSSPGTHSQTSKATQHQLSQTRGPPGHYQTESGLKFLAADASWASVNNTGEGQNPAGLVKT